MKIAIISPITLSAFNDLVGDSLPDGYKYPLGSIFVKHLLECGHEVTVITNTTDVIETTVWEAPRLRIYATPRRRRARHLCRDFYYAERREMLKAVQNESPDVVHAQWTYEFAAVAISSKLPHLITARDSPPMIFRYFKDTYRFLRLIYSYMVIPRCQALVSNSPYLARSIKRAYGKKSYATIPNGIPVSVSSPKKNYARATEDKFIVTVVANWDKRKNIPVAIEALKLMQRESNTIEMHLFGNGLGKGQEAEHYAKESGVTENIFFHGYTPLEDVRKFHIDNTDVLLHPSLEESFGMTILEAMALGIPAIGGEEAGAVPWVIGEGGLTLDIRNPDEIAKAVLPLEKNRTVLAKLGAAARQRAISEFSMSSVVTQYERLYHEILTKDS